MGVAYTDFKEIQQSIDDLVSYLESKGIALPRQSRLALAIDRGRQIVECSESKVVPPELDAHLCGGDFANVWWLSSLVARVRGTAFECELLPRLVALAKADPLPLTPGEHSTERDTMFETIVGCVCSLFASAVHFAEPDVLCTYKQVRWGLACKVAYGSSKQTAKNIRAGMGQIERSGAELGLVVVQMTNRFPHDKMYAVDHPSGGIVSLHDEAAQRTRFTGLLAPLVRDIELQMAQHLKRYPRKRDYRVRGGIFPASTVAYFRARRVVMGGVAFTRLSKLAAMPEDEFVESFNRWWQEI